MFVTRTRYVYSSSKLAFVIFGIVISIHSPWLVLLFTEKTISWAYAKTNFTLYVSGYQNIRIDPVFMQRSEYSTYTIYIYISKLQVLLKPLKAK